MMIDMGMFDIFFIDIKCPKCREVSKEVEFQTKSLDNCMREFRVGDRLILNDLEIVYGYINNATGECPKCNTHLKGEIRIVDGGVFGLESVKAWEIKS